MLTKTQSLFVQSAATALLIMAFSSHSSAGSAETIAVTSLCEMKLWGKEMEGRRVRLKAGYSSDFTHSAHLSDRACPSFSLELGIDSDNPPDDSVSRFDQTLSKHLSYYSDHTFWVDSTGIFQWEEEVAINAKLSPRKQFKVPAHGVFSMEKVWGFEQADK